MLIPVQKAIPESRFGKFVVRTGRDPGVEMGEISGLECKPSLGNLQASFFEIFVSKFCGMYPPVFVFWEIYPSRKHYSVGTPVWRTLGKVNDHDFPIWGYLVTWDMCWKEYAIAAAMRCRYHLVRGNRIRPFLWEGAGTSGLVCHLHRHSCAWGRVSGL